MASPKCAIRRRASAVSVTDTQNTRLAPPVLNQRLSAFLHTSVFPMPPLPVTLLDTAALFWFPTKNARIFPSSLSRPITLPWCGSSLGSYSLVNSPGLNSCIGRSGLGIEISSQIKDSMRLLPDGKR